MRVAVNHMTGAFSILDKAASHLWAPDPWLGAAGILFLDHPALKRRELSLSQAKEIRVERKSDSVVEVTFQRFPLGGDAGTLEAAVRTRLSLGDSDDSLRVEVLAVDLPADWTFAELEYPCRLGALKTDVDEGYTVIPSRQGCIVPCTTGKWKEVPNVALWAWDDGPWTDRGVADLGVYGHVEASMPFFGAVHGKSALAVVLDTEIDAAIRCVLNSNYQNVFNETGELSPYSRLAVCSPVWRATRHAFGYPRAATYTLLPGGDYVSIAKHYRKAAQRQGLWVSLRDKIKANPNIAGLLGAALINLDGGYPWHIDYPAYRYTWNDVRKFIDDIKSYTGLQRALLCLWIGYQNYPPDSYPFHPANGTLEELKSMVQYAKGQQFLACFYHGYPALMDHAPNCNPAHARKSPSGKMSSRWGRHCSAFFLEHAKKNLPRSIRDSGQVADYTDILTSGGIAECYGKDHEMTRAQDRDNRAAVLQYINSLGLFTGSEHPKGWAAPHVAYFKNGGLGSYHWILDQFRVPLFHLVYKDAVLMFREAFPQPDSSMLTDLAVGCHFQLHFNWRAYWQPGYWNSREGARINVQLFQDFDRATALQELVSHEYLADPAGAFRTRFSDGTEAIANPTNKVYEYEQGTVNPETITLKFADSRRIEAAARRDWVINTS
ncbi:MAG: DUF5696 domain-containing protein [Candidatus Sumerlaeota bacterium]|nr:DUF5696 domain-containing protein [Candidatus Sumerlaeota bacterium]